MLAKIIFFVVVLSLIIFIIESIILPSIRLKLRYRLFEIRDRLRNHAAANPGEISTIEFRYLEGMINVSIGFLKHFSLIDFLIARRRLRNHKDWMNVIDKRKLKVFESENPFVREIFRDVSNVASSAVIINSAVLIIAIIIPLFIVVSLLRNINKLRKKLNEGISSILILPPHLRPSLLGKEREFSI